MSAISDLGLRERSALLRSVGEVAYRDENLAAEAFDEAQVLDFHVGQFNHGAGARMSARRDLFRLLLFLFLRFSSRHGGRRSGTRWAIGNCGRSSGAVDVRRVGDNRTVDIRWIGDNPPPVL